jgi:hypothetical protein
MKSWSLSAVHHGPRRDGRSSVQPSAARHRLRQPVAKSRFGISPPRISLARLFSALRSRRRRLSDDLETLFTAARNRGNEGLMIKDLDSFYTPGRRGKSWLKMKRELATLDVVVTAVEYGHGKRIGVLSDYTFAVWDGERLVNIGKAYSGLTDAEIAEMTQWFLAHKISEHGLRLEVEPKDCLEVAFNNMMRSTRHESGYALRFPRIVRLRPDKLPEDADTIETVKEIYERQHAGMIVQVVMVVSRWPGAIQAVCNDERLTRQPSAIVMVVIAGVSCSRVFLRTAITQLCAVSQTTCSNWIVVWWMPNPRPSFLVDLAQNRIALRSRHVGDLHVRRERVVFRANAPHMQIVHIADARDLPASPIPPPPGSCRAECPRAEYSASRARCRCSTTESARRSRTTRPRRSSIVPSTGWQSRPQSPPRSRACRPPRAAARCGRSHRPERHSSSAIAPFITTPAAATQIITWRAHARDAGSAERLVENKERNRHQRQRIDQRGQHSGAPVAIGLGGARRTAFQKHRDQRQQQRQKVGEVMSRLGKQRQRVRADAGHHQQDDVKHGDGERDAQHPPRPMRMPVSAVRVHATRIAQGCLCGAGAPPPSWRYLPTSSLRSPKSGAESSANALSFSGQLEIKMKKTFVIPALLLLARVAAQTSPARRRDRAPIQESRQQRAPRHHAQPPEKHHRRRRSHAGR